jgi:hypothetical protein
VATAQMIFASALGWEDVDRLRHLPPVKALKAAVLPR